MAKISEAKRKEIEETSARFKPKQRSENEPANGNLLWHLNRMGLLKRTLDISGTGTITKLDAWQMMRDAQLEGIDFSRDED
jgi:hypothetical protein